MAKSPTKTTVEVIAGQNEPVNHVIRFEDLVQNLKRGAAKPVQARATAQHREQLEAIQKLAADLEKRLRAVRASDEPAPAAKRSTRGRKGKA